MAPTRAPGVRANRERAPCVRDARHHRQFNLSSGGARKHTHTRAPQTRGCACVRAYGNVWRLIGLWFYFARCARRA